MRSTIRPAPTAGNSRTGVTRKTLTGEFGELEIATPRDRNGEFEPKIVRKNQTRWTGFDDKILSMYARGMTTREIQGHLEEMYQVEVSPRLISEVTDAVMEQARAWQNRPLEPFYGVVFLDALYVKMRHEGRVENRAVYVAPGINLEVRKEVLGLWTSASEGAKFWLHVLTELRNRGVRDIYLVCVDGLKGFPQAIESIFPHAQVQLCIVHLVRGSLNYVTWQDRKKVVTDLKPVYRATTADEAEQQLREFETRWPKYPAIALNNSFKNNSGWVKNQSIGSAFDFGYTLTLQTYGPGSYYQVSSHDGYTPYCNQTWSQVCSTYGCTYPPPWNSNASINVLRPTLSRGVIPYWLGGSTSSMITPAKPRCPWETRTALLRLRIGRLLAVRDLGI